MTTTADGCKLIGGGRVVSHHDYRSSKKKNIFKLEQEFDGCNPYMKFGRNPIKMTKLESPQQWTGRRTEGWTDKPKAKELRKLAGGALINVPTIVSCHTQTEVIGLSRGYTWGKFLISRAVIS